MHNIENDTPPLISNLAHGVSNIRISNNRPSRDHYVCPQYLANHCNKGENCIFTHVLGNTNNLKSNRTPNSTKNSTNLVSMDIKSIRGKVATLAKDQQGCRVLQHMLENHDDKVFEVIWGECYKHIQQLMIDPFGNYLIQKLLEQTSDQQRLSILQRVRTNIVSISLNIHGTRVIQKLLEHMTLSEEKTIVRTALINDVVALSKDLNGNHCVQRCLHFMTNAENQFIYEAIASNITTVSTHKHGCCVVQRCIDYSSQHQRLLLEKKIVKHSLQLVQDPFANYVVQYVLNKKNVNAIARRLEGNFSILAVQKFSSNVVEKCLELSDRENVAMIVDELLDPERLPRHVQDPYANYVIQKALNVLDQKSFDRAIAILKPFVRGLKATTFGKRIQAKMVKKFPILADDNDF